jgi:hypothetical protein
VLRAFLAGTAALLVTLPFLWRHTLDYIELLPRYGQSAWLRASIQREEPKVVADIVWSGGFSLVLSLVAVSAAIACGLMARRDRSRETDWHHLALALSPYLAPFGFFWTTLLIASLPLFFRTLHRAVLAQGPARALAIAGLAVAWLLMQLVQVGDLMIPVYHAAGVVLLVLISLALLARARSGAGQVHPAFASDL